MRQLVTNTGFGTGLDWRPNPGIGFPGYANYLPTTFYDFASLSRTWGTDIFSPDAKKLLLNTDPKNVEAARWLAP